MALNFPNEKVCNNVAAEFQFQHGNLGILQFKSKPQTQRIFSAELFLTNLPLVKKKKNVRFTFKPYTIFKADE